MAIDTAPKKITIEQLIDLLGTIPAGERRIIGIAGPPGSGKSTLATQIESALNARAAGYAAVFPMDGFHFDDRVLIPRGLRPRKGAPETFDVDGFGFMLERLRSNASEEIAVPVFDRDIEIARAGASMIPRAVRAILVEGNYLLLDRGPWMALNFDMTIALDVSRETLRSRLVDRWVRHGKSKDEIVAQVDSNDMINVDLVLQASRRANYVIAEH
ncbi:nucleoside triphosphate hydrolase [Rhizobium sp. P38BS-XIX]|uniref:nucleoside triphosphate hydrolase n=1 Tax=Rhizobium sp. P38BS-XIX TaxID=2726740 RepID=UPI001456F994|nr:nucleoside triphosphate hydrolase [Rhizobium sp. P38BS-XIX]NLS01641.1 nucleoside triphosphate hydrolase [Rhizobium sp. P38BS-XIX]